MIRKFVRESKILKYFANLFALMFKLQKKKAAENSKLRPSCCIVWSQLYHADTNSWASWLRTPSLKLLPTLCYWRVTSAWTVSWFRTSIIWESSVQTMRWKKWSSVNFFDPTQIPIRGLQGEGHLHWSLHFFLVIKASETQEMKHESERGDRSWLYARAEVSLHFGARDASPSY